jgi:excisionase family DNA binding protein
MDVILFLIGVLMVATGKFRLASWRTAGRHVRAAGVVLMIPGAANFAAGFVLLFIYGGDFEAIFAAFDQIAPFMMAIMMIAVVLAYLLIADPPGAPHLPGMLGRIQSERRAGQHPLVSQQTRSFSSVLSVADAAAYMNVPPAKILEWIEAGQLPAARDSSGYQIARSRLDELKSGKAADL